MKTQIFTLMALASTATATLPWLDAKKFDCPANTDNQCIEPQKNGFSWEGLNLGKFSNFGDFDFDGFECADSFDGKVKRDEITGRTFQNKCIKGKVTKEKSPSFGCTTSQKVKKFSVKTFQISVEFDITLEFHYDMPNGSVCKQKQLCKKSGTTVKNTQCGGATKVKVTVPKGQDKPCNVGFHHIDFDCDKPQKPVSSTTVRRSSTAVLPTPTPSKGSETTVSTPGGSKTPSATPSSPASETQNLPTPTPSSPASETENLPTPTPESSTSSISPIGSTSAESIPSESTPASETTPAETAPASETTPSSETTPASETEALPTPTPESSTTPASPIESNTAPFGNSSVPATQTTPAVTPPATTVFSTSVFTETAVSTITSCGEDVKDCPAGSSTVITQTSVTSTVVPVTTDAPGPEPTTVVVVDHTTVIVQTSTTLCPVTLTHITQGTTAVETTLSTSTIFLTSISTICTKCTAITTAIPSQTPGQSSPVETPGQSSPVETPGPVETSSLGPITTATQTTPATPLPTADCPDILPQCLNTWLFSAGCKSNTDTNCFCSSNDFVDNVYKCLSAHGASDDEVDSAEKYFQGICASHVPENPAIITGVNTLTLTVTAAPTAHTAPVTTIILETTIVVPCTETAGPSEGSIIPGSSTMQIISTAITVPQVVFQTITGTSTNAVSLVQGTPTAPAVVTPGFTTPLVQTTFAPAPTTLASLINPGQQNGTATGAPPQFTGAASRSGMTAGSFIAAGLVALMAL